MKTPQKFFGLLLVVILVVGLALSVSGASAQSGGNTTPTPLHQHRAQGNGNLMQGMPGDDTMWAAVAEALDIDVETLVAELRSGKTLEELAEEHNLDVQTLYDAQLAVMTEHMNAQVEAGHMTQEEADEHLAWMSEHVAEMPMMTGAGMGAHSMDEMMGMMEGAMHGQMSGGMHGMMGHMSHDEEEHEEHSETESHGMHNMMGKGMRGGMSHGGRGH
jgi:hypothetical protein